jgi:hypothetical protein
VHIFTTALEAKRLALLHDLVPNAQTIGILANPGFLYAADEVRQIEAAAHGLGQQILILRASTPAEFDAAFDLVTREHIRALSVSAAPFFDSRRDQLVALGASWQPSYRIGRTNISWVNKAKEIAVGIARPAEVACKSR